MQDLAQKDQIKDEEFDIQSQLDGIKGEEEREKETPEIDRKVKGEL